MNQMIETYLGFGEIGADTEASPGNGRFYVRLYDGNHDVCGFDTVEQAREELYFLADQLDSSN